MLNNSLIFELGIVQFGENRVDFFENECSFQEFDETLEAKLNIAEITL